MKLAFYAAAAVMACATPAFAESVKVGQLQCEVAAGLGMIIASSKAMECRFLPVRGRAEFYHGLIHKFGLDLGGTDRGMLVWDVFAPTAGPFAMRWRATTPALARRRRSASASAATRWFAAPREIGLQPLSVQTADRPRPRRRRVVECSFAGASEPRRLRPHLEPLGIVGGSGEPPSRPALADDLDLEAVLAFGVRLLDVAHRERLADAWP